MNTYHKKVKIYVIIAIIAIIIVAKFVSLGLSKNHHFTLAYVTHELKAAMFKYELGRFSLVASSSALTNLDTVNFDYTKSIPVIVYHGIPNSDIPNQYSITPENFKDQMFALKKSGYNTITTQELYKYLKGELSLPQKSVLITFDDGRIDSYEMADPILEALDYKATMFVIGRYSLLGERLKYYLSTNQLTEMNQNGRWDIEAHSYDGHESYLIAPNQKDGHFFSHKQWLISLNRLETDQEFDQRIKNDFEKVKTGLEALIKKPVQSFAFPYGDFGQNSSNYNGAVNANIQEAQKLFNMIFYQTAPSQRFRNNYQLDKQFNNNFFLIKRITVDPQWKGSDLIAYLQRTTAKKLPYNDNFKQDGGWLRLWGTVTLDNKNEMVLDAKEGETGATTILDGTRLWKDYSVKATVISSGKSPVYVWARFQDDDNNTACNFSDGFVHIEQTVSGKQKIIQGVVNSNLSLPAEEFQVEAKVKGRNIQCIFNNNIMAESTFLDPSLDSGGIGFKTWEKDPGKANIIVKKLDVEILN